ncbi:MAG: hypothetical protein HC899_10125 [Leptolyngbyaceae cyanobacterium SM1_4_3]|nr:hypothetical protein [Leptolyngbyaceae cyanobacterium SM1_4_3]
MPKYRSSYSHQLTIAYPVQHIIAPSLTDRPLPTNSDRLQVLLMQVDRFSGSIDYVFV